MEYTCTGQVATVHVRKADDHISYSHLILYFSLMVGMDLLSMNWTIETTDSKPQDLLQLVAATVSGLRSYSQSIPTLTCVH